MELVDEEDRVPGFLHLVQGLFDALFKLAPVLGPGHHAGEVQGQNPLVQQVVRHVAQDDFPGQALGNGGLAHAGLANEAGVVLRPAGENLNHPLDFIVPAHHGVQLAVPGVGGQVPGELPEGFAASAGPAAGGGAPVVPGGGGLAALGPLVQLLHQGGVEGPGVHPRRAEDADGHVVPLPQEARQQVLRAHIRAAAADGVLHGDLHHPAGPGGQALGGIPAGEARSHAALDDLDDHIVGEPGLQEHVVGGALVLPDQAQQQVLGAHIAVTQLACGLLAEAEGLLRAGAEFFLIHVRYTSFHEGRFFSFLPCCGSGPGAPPPAQNFPRRQPSAFPSAGR